MLSATCFQKLFQKQNWNFIVFKFEEASFKNQVGYPPVLLPSPCSHQLPGNSTCFSPEAVTIAPWLPRQHQGGGWDWTSPVESRSIKCAQGRCGPMCVGVIIAWWPKNHRIDTEVKKMILNFALHLNSILFVFFGVKREKKNHMLSVWRIGLPTLRLRADDGIQQQIHSHYDLYPHSVSGWLMAKRLKNVIPCHANYC